MSIFVKNALESHTNFLVYEEKRPWGSFKKFTENTRSTVKFITVNPHSKLSLQRHMLRDEFWIVVSGECRVIIGDKNKLAKKGDEFFICRGINHRVETENAPVEIMEISTGEFDEDDIIRIEDEYGRI